MMEWSLDFPRKKNYFLPFFYEKIKRDKFRMVKKRKSTIPKIDDGIPKCCFCNQPGLTKESLIRKKASEYHKKS